MSKYNIIDRRKNPGGKNLPNRQRFIRRARQKIQDRLRESTQRRAITSDDDEQIQIDLDGVDEPNFSYDSGSGEWDYVLPGNREYVPGDLIPKPPRRGGQGGGGRAGTGDSEDSFEFSISKEEYLSIIFDDLELPDLVKASEKATENWQRRRSGHSRDGPAANLDLGRTLRNSLGRRIALAFPLDRQIRELEERLESETDAAARRDLEAQLELLRIRRLSVAYIDPLDIRYRRFERVPVPNSQAVMFCVMDVSGSMGETEKEIAKRFFLLLYLFLERKYKRVDIVFIKHTEEAAEVTEEEFFYSTESGGTAISTGLRLMQEIIGERYPSDTWNLYCVQATDGDNMSTDNEEMMVTLHELLPLFQYFVYNEVCTPDHISGFEGERHSAIKLIRHLEPEFPNLKTIMLSDVIDVVPNFREVFSKK